MGSQGMDVAVELLGLAHTGMSARATLQQQYPKENRLLRAKKIVS